MAENERSFSDEESEQIAHYAREAINNLEIEQRIVPYNEIFEQPDKFNELVRAFAKEGPDGITFAHHLSNQYLLMAFQTIKQHGSFLEAERYEKIVNNLLKIGDDANNLLQILDPNSDSHILTQRKLQ